MGKYIVNHTINDYITTNIDNSELKNKDNINIIVLDESTNDKLSDYYNNVRDMIVAGARVYIIAVGTESKIKKSLFILAANYKNYNLYKVDSKDTITSDYINTIIQRNPTIDEIQTFVGGDISGYSDISVILLGIDDLTRRGDIEGLKEFIETHVNSIENLTNVVEYMKKIVDTDSSNELLGRINELQESLKTFKTKLENAEKENDKIKDENLKLLSDGETAKQALSRAMSEKKTLEEQLSNNSPIMKAYTKIETSLINYKTKSIIYFKEVSPVNYINSFISKLTEFIKLSGNKVKLIIFDSEVGLGTYTGLNIITGNDFISNKRNYISVTDSFVVVEPNPVILTSILTSVNPMFDVVIVYDRLKQYEFIVDGNNVTKYFVIKSSSDFKAIQSKLKITDKSSIITRPGSSIGPETLNIPYMADYTHGISNTASIAKYKKLQCEGSNKPLFDTILAKARVERKK